MRFALRSSTPAFAGLERWFMSLREGYPGARPPGAHYCLSLSRGDITRSVRLGRAGVGALAALALISFAWTASVTAYVAFHDDLMGAILARQAEMKAAVWPRRALSSTKRRAGNCWSGIPSTAR